MGYVKLTKIFLNNIQKYKKSKMKKFNKFEIFLKTQKKKIEKELSVSATNNKIAEWIEQKSQWFRDMWNKSKCKDCCKVLKCGYRVRKKCKQFEEQKDEEN